MCNWQPSLLVHTICHNDLQMMVAMHKFFLIMISSTTTLIITWFNARDPNCQKTHYFVMSQNEWRLRLLMSDAKFTNAHSFAIHFKKNNVCFEVFVECIICFGELKKTTSSLLFKSVIYSKKHILMLQIWNKVVLRTSNTLTLSRGPKTLDLMVALIS